MVARGSSNPDVLNPENVKASQNRLTRSISSSESYLHHKRLRISVLK